MSKGNNDINITRLRTVKQQSATKAKKHIDNNSSSKHNKGVLSNDRSNSSSISLKNNYLFQQHCLHQDELQGQQLHHHQQRQQTLHDDTWQPLSPGRDFVGMRLDGHGPPLAPATKRGLPGLVDQEGDAQGHQGQLQGAAKALVHGGRVRIVSC